MAQLPRLTNEDIQKVLEELFNSYFYFLPDVPQTALVTANRISSHIFGMSSAELTQLGCAGFEREMRQRVSDLCFKFGLSLGGLYSSSPTACVLEVSPTTESYPHVSGTLKCGIGYTLARRYDAINDQMYMILSVGTYR